MEISEALPFLVFIILAVGYIIKLLLPKSFFQSIFVPKKKMEALDQFFSKGFYYYALLNEKQKNRFLYRIHDVSKRLTIKGRNGFEVTYAVRLFVAAAQVQLTFGYKRYFLSKFRAVYIYPDKYLNKMTGKMHNGEVNPRGLIVLSWKHFVKGYQDPNDKINLGLHEMAHALMHTIIHSNEHEIGLDNYMRNIIRLSKVEIHKIKSNKIHFLRKYAGTNIFEFFAVSIEYFFEAPQDFYNNLPTMYTHLTRLLKQDPVNRIYAIKQ